MSEENETIDEEIFEEDGEEDETDSVEEEQNGHGPGFRLGILLGLIVGAVVAVLLAPPTGEEEQGTVTSESAAGSSSLSPDFAADSPFGRISTIIQQVRSRVREASREAEIAARETEELAHARLAELTHQDQPSDE